MTVTEVKKIAKEKGVAAGKMKKQELVQAIQTAEGNVPCFMTEAANGCPQEDCLWRGDCVK